MRRILSFDIEVDWDKIEPFNLVVQKGSSPIQMIGAYDWFKNKYYSFFYHKNLKITPAKNKKLFLLLAKRFNTNKFVVKDGKFNSSESKLSWNCRYLYFKNERTMLSSFMKFITDISPDIYHGFFIETFDLVYIINRCRTLNISSSHLSPLRTVYVSHGEANIRGSIIYDIPPMYAKFMGTHRHANSLKKIAESHLKRDDEHKITKTSESIINEDWYDKDWKKFIEYCLVDVELCVLLEKQLRLISRCEGFEFFTGVNPNFIGYTSHIIESFFSYIKPIYEKEVLNNKYKIAFDTKKYEIIERASGALVLPSIAGLYETGLVLILDLKKEYPKIIESLNISIETLRKAIDPKEKHKYNYCEENDVYYIKKPIGFVPFALKLLYKIRDRIENERDKLEYGSKEYNEINEQRQTIKDTINAVSGLFDYSKSIMVNPELANSIRMTGKKEIKIADEFARLFGEKTKVEIQVIYGDTDSIFVWLKNVEDVEIAKKIAKEITKWIQKGFDNYAKRLNIDQHQFEIDLEKILDVFVSTGKKKKYFGHVLWADGNDIKEENSLYIRGFESRRSDSAEFTDFAQKDIFKLINKTKKLGWNKVRKQILQKLRTEYPEKFVVDNMLEIGIPKGMKKPLDQYKVTNPWRDGCIYSNKYLNGQFSVGSKPKLLYIERVKPNEQNLPFTNSLSIEEGMIIPENIFVIDKEKMMEKTVFDKLKKVLRVLGIDDIEIKDGLKETTMFDFINKYQNKTKEKTKIIDNNTLDIILEESNEILKKL